MIRKIFGVRGNNWISTDLLKRLFDLKFSNFVKYMLSVFLTLFSIASWAGLSISGEYGDLPRTSGNFTLKLTIYGNHAADEISYGYDIYEKVGSNPRVLITKGGFDYQDFDPITGEATIAINLSRSYTGTVTYIADIEEVEYDCPFGERDCFNNYYDYSISEEIFFITAPQKPNISITQCNSTSSLPYSNSFYQSQDGRYQINWSAAKVDNPDEFIIQQQINSGTWTQIAKYGAYQGSANYKKSLCVTREGGNLYRYRVIAKNLKGSATSNVLGVEVEAPNSPPSATILTPANSQSFSIHDVNAYGGQIRLEATATDDNQVKSVGYYVRPSSSTVDSYYTATLTNSKYIYNLSNIAPGTYSLRVKAEDYDGAVFESASRQFTIVDNYQPAVTSVNFNSDTIYIGQTVSVNITASDVDDGIDKLNLIVGGTIADTYSPENNPTTINHTFNWTPPSPGEYQVGAQAIDTTGAFKSSSANIPLTVISVTPPSKPNNPIACGFSEVSCQSSNELSSVDGVYLNNDTGFTLSWPAVNSDYYLLECKGCPNSQTNSFELVNSANSNEFFVASNFPQGTYEYRVSACFENPATASGPKPDSDYCSAPSSSSFVKLFYETPSVPVITGSGNELSEGKYTLAWNNVLTRDDCNQVESPCYYRVEQKLGGVQSAESWQLFSLSDENTTNIEVLDKAVGIYSYRILACNSNGCSTSANQKVVTVAAPYINKVELACNNSCVEFEGSFFSDDAVIRVVTDHKNNFTEYDSSVAEWVNLGAQSIARLPLTPDIALAMQRGVFNLSIINPNGSRDSASSLGDAEILINLADASVASNNNGSVLYFANKNKLHAVSAVTGESMTGQSEGVNFASWPFITAEGEFKAAPIVDDQTDTVFIGSTNDNMYAIYPTGEEKWRYHSGGNIVSAGLLDSDNSLYFGALNGYLYSLYSENGEVEWIYKAGAPIAETPEISGDNRVIYASTADGIVHTIRRGILGAEKLVWTSVWNSNLTLNIDIKENDWVPDPARHIDEFLLTSRLYSSVIGGPLQRDILTFWTRALVERLSLEELSEAFISSGEGFATELAAASDSEFVELLFERAFGVVDAPEIINSGGHAYDRILLKEMLAEEERVDRATIASLIISAVENVNQDRDYIDAYDIFYGSFYQDLGLSCPEDVNCDLYRIDADNDGLPDYWEIFYFGSIDVENGNDDTDGDGQTNLEEYVANLDPCLLGCYVGIPDGEILPAAMPAPLDSAILLASDQTQVIPGTFRVNESGAATYSIPISLPSGTAGVTPSLSLEYTSQNGNGLIGQGWSLGGISSIARCRKTLGHDGVAMPITWTADDRFCLDGQRLVMMKNTGNGVYGGNGVGYRTEIESDLKITSYGGTPSNPTYFIAEAKDGSLRYFGGNSATSQYTSDGKYIISWALESEKDSVGNEVKYTYNTIDGVRLTRIDYGFGNTSTAASSVILNYKNNRPDPRSSYISGYLVRSDHLLSSIEVWNDNQELRTYKLDYLDMADDLLKLSRVSNIHETRNDVVMSTTKFEWGGFNGSFESTPFDTVVLNSWDKKYIPTNQPADINGDGRLDFIWQEVKPDADGDIDDQYFNYILASENGFTELQGNIKRGESTQNSWPMQTIDYNADGRSDLAYYQRAREGRWWIHISHPGIDNWRIDGNSYVVETDISQLDARFVDINSDGLTDIIFPGGYRLLEPNPAKNISDLDYYHFGPTHPITYNGLESWVDDGSIPYSYFTYFAPGATGDFNGDGKVDFILMDVRINFPSDEQTSRVYLAHLEGSELVLSEKLGEYEDTDVSGKDVDIRHLDIRTSFRTGDFNGDGLTDLLMQENGSARDVYSYRYLINQGAMVNGSHFIGWNDDSYAIGEIAERSNIQLVDYDLDGAVDLIWADYDNSSLVLRRWVGNTLQPQRTIRSIANDQNRQHLIFDMSGDGRPDYVNITDKILRVYLSEGDGEPLNVVTQVTNGWGAVTEITYDTLADSEHYARYDIPTTNVESCHQETELGIYFGQIFCANVQMVNSAEYYSVLNGNWQFDDWPSELPALGAVQTLDKFQPVLELIGPMQVVTRVNSSAPSGDEVSPNLVNKDATSAISYYYTQAQIQAAGRGILGFQRLATIDEQTGVVTETRYRQDFPFTGSPMYTTRRTREGNLLGVSGNEWRVKDWSSNWPDLVIAEGQGTTSLGALRPYISRAYDISYDLENNGASQGILLTTVTTENGIPDKHGNVDFVKVTTEAGGKIFVKTTRSEYGPGSISFDDYNRTLNSYAELGRLTRSVITHSRSGMVDINRTSGFEYYDNGPMAGLMKKEIVEPDQRGTTLWSEKTYGYDQFGNQVEVTLDGVDRNGNVLTRASSTEYDSLGRYMVKEINAYDQIVSDVLEFNEYGQPLRVRDINGVVSQSRITQFGSPYLQYHPNGAASFEYKAPVDGTYCPEVAVFRSHMISNSGSHKVACYDNIGRDVRMAVQLLDGRWSYVDTEYDSLGRTKRKSEPYTLAAQYWTTYEYDIIGRIVKVTQPGEVGDAVTHNEYNGYTSRVINPLGQIREETKNGVGEVAEIVDSAGVSPSTITNRYDSQGNLIEVITSGSDGLSVSMTVDYDLIGRKVSMDDPDKGRWEYVYNSFDELEEQTDAKGQSTVMYHDLLGRMIERKDFVGAENSELESHSKWVYNNAATSLGYGLIGNYGRGQMLRNEDLTTGYTQLSSYDHLGRNVENVMQLPGDDTLYYQSTTFDQFGREHRVFDSASDITGQDSAIENHYNDYGYLTRVTDAVYANFGPRHTYYDIQAVDARGNVVKEQQGSWVTTEREYNTATGRLLEINTYSANPLVANSELQQQSYTWDNIGNLISRSDESGDKNLYEEFTYDHLNRLSTVSLNGAISSEVTYDSLGNIRSKTGVGTYNYLCGDTSGVAGAVASGPHAVCSTSDGGRYYYDANGNMIQDTAVGEAGGRNLQYTTFDKPKQITKGGHTTKFEYGPSRARYQRIDISSKGTQTTRYIGNIERVTQSDGVEEVKRYLGNTLIITKINAAGSITAIDLSYILKDHLGSTDVIVGANGGILQAQSFDPWGLRRNATDWAAVSIAVLLTGSNGSSIKNYTTRGFTGHEMLDEVGIVHMNGRIYDPRLGRFLQADPKIDGVDFSQGYNRYSYLHNNPLNGTDPSGYNGIRQYAGLIVGAILVAATWGAGGAATSVFLETWYGAAALGAITGAVGAAANGGNVLQGLAIGALSGAAFNQAGAYFSESAWYLKTAAHGVVGGITNVLQGGEFGHGFITSGLSKGFSLGADGLGLGNTGQFAAAVLAGGTSSKLTGGKFANGASSAALAFAVNKLGHEAGQAKNKPVSTNQQGQSSEAGAQEGLDRHEGKDGYSHLESIGDITFENDVPGGAHTDRAIDTDLVDALHTSLDESGLSVNVNSTTGGHGVGTPHYNGKALDINQIGGVRVQFLSDNGLMRDVVVLQRNLMMQPGVIKVFGPVYNYVKVNGSWIQASSHISLQQSHSNHIHVQVE